MRFFLLRILLAFGLFSAGESAFSATYKFSLYGGNGFFTTKSLDCNTVGAGATSVIQGVNNIGAPGAYFFFAGSCGGAWRTVGDAHIVYVGRYLSGGWSNANDTVTFVSVSEDDVIDDVSGIPVQRVLVFLSFAFALIVGVIAGQQR